MRFFLLFLFFLLSVATIAHPVDKKKIYFVINPISGTKSKKNIPDLIKEKIDSAQFDYEVLYTKGQGDATSLSRKAAKEGAACIVAVGGDGTVNEVAKGVLHSDTALGIVPMGSGNGLAKHLKLPSDPSKALELINQQKTSLIDSVMINDDFFFGTAGIGFDAHIAKEFAKKKKRGFFSYLIIFIKEYHKYEPKELELIVDGVKMRKKALIISFANSSQYGNNVQIAPKAKINDGYLDLVFLDTPPKHAMINTSLRAVNGSIDHSKYYHTIRCTEITIDEPHLQAHVDGEPCLFENGIHIKLIPASLKIIR